MWANCDKHMLWIVVYFMIQLACYVEPIANITTMAVITTTKRPIAILDSPRGDETTAHWSSGKIHTHPTVSTRNIHSIDGLSGNKRHADVGEFIPLYFVAIIVVLSITTCSTATVLVILCACQCRKRQSTGENADADDSSLSCNSSDREIGMENDDEDDEDDDSEKDFNSILTPPTDAIYREGELFQMESESESKNWKSESETDPQQNESEKLLMNKNDHSTSVLIHNEVSDSTDTSHIQNRAKFIKNDDRKTQKDETQVEFVPLNQIQPSVDSNKQSNDDVTHPCNGENSL